MSDIAIRCEGLGKQYRIGQRESFKTLRDTIADTLSSPFGRLRSAFNGTRTQVENGREDSFWALKDVSFEIKRGEVVGIIGRNGAGKSTLLKILSRITQPTEGEVTMNGRVASLLEVGTGFHPELTGRENIFLNGAILGMKRAEIRHKFDEIVAFAEIEKFIDTPVKRYSSGMYVRLAFAVAAHLEPEILLVDEVLAVGDAAFQKRCLGKMQDVAKQGRTVLFVSHNMGAVRQLCQSGILLEKGAITCVGQVHTCLEEYASEPDKAHGSITDHITYLHPSLKIESFTVNGSSDDHLHIPTGMGSLKVNVSAYLSEPMQLDVEARIYDLYDNPLAFFSPAHERGFANRYPEGRLHLSTTIGLPSRMTSGDFYLSLAVTHSGVETLVDMPRAVKLEVEGTPMRTGVNFNYYKGAGWLLLTGVTDEMGESSS